MITAAGTEMLRNHVKPNERVQKERTYVFRTGTTAILGKTNIRSLVVNEVVTPVGAGGDAMDIS